ncbi:hypothetical protein DE4587_01332 [Mycobacteroides salmoniphilum]|nr:hypothetical protein DE4586_01416 [Mycobacteroides salmoniphilum]TDZ88962.1 hypothetical protein DE4587_01332 [Mycobacteroides salmoniphilum]
MVDVMLIPKWGLTLCSRERQWAVPIPSWQS